LRWAGSVPRAVPQTREPGCGVAKRSSRCFALCYLSFTHRRFELLTSCCPPASPTPSRTLTAFSFFLPFYFSRTSSSGLWSRTSRPAGSVWRTRWSSLLVPCLSRAEERLWCSRAAEGRGLRGLSGAKRENKRERRWTRINTPALLEGAETGPRTGCVQNRTGSGLRTQAEEKTKHLSQSQIKTDHFFEHTWKEGTWKVWMSPWLLLCMKIV